MNKHSIFSQFHRRFLFVIVICALIISTFMSPSQTSALPARAFGAISFVSNIETAGVVVSGMVLPATAQLFYRRAGETNWQSGHNLLRIKDGRLIGSLFNL
ncbi:MAG: hypothetical protein HYU84_12005, partial [Chloroflexi bacterium]|nr:hypothetical protein [Chloroflexota bacterium]